MEEIIFSEEFHETLEYLVLILYEQEYFGFVESAILYALKIYTFIEENIDKPISRITPKSHQQFGKNFIKYKANAQNDVVYFL